VAGRAAVSDSLGGAPGKDAAFFVPAVVTDAPVDALVWNEETFGPVLPVMRVGDADEAVARANASPFGLSASVWSRNRRRARAVARRLAAGSVMINDAASIGGIADVPHGGVRASGIGKSHGAAGIEECVRVKAIVEDRFARWRQPWWFGYTPRLTSALDGFARFAQGRSLLERLRAVPVVLRLMFRPDRPV
jgi:acyl-CoA reductase-like NAD-dependent aldehyde dehydrogenase